MSLIVNALASELAVDPSHIKTAINLLDEGATVPFIARYRKEATNGLDDTQLRLLAKRLSYLRALAERKLTVINTISELGKLTPALERQINQLDNKTQLEDLYRPFKSKRQTKGQIAIAAGLEPLANKLLASPQTSPLPQAKLFINPAQAITSAAQALDGATAILIDRFASEPQLMVQIRDYVWHNSQLESKAARKKNPPLATQLVDKYRNYLSYSEPLKRVPSHRVLAMLRGRNDGVLQLTLNCDPHQQGNRCLHAILKKFNINNQGRAADDWLIDAATQCWKTRIYPSIENELLAKVREQADQQAIEVFATNLSDLLLAAPAGEHITIGLDPGIRTGVKVAIVDGTGKVLATDTIYPHPPRNQWQQSITTLFKLVKQHRVSLISIGNGTGSRETEKLVLQCKKEHPDFTCTSLMVSEAGASVYSASELAALEFPQMDVSLRGAVSIARRLQDPLAELVKIEPKAIGVGQYQHDVNQTQLSQRLDEVVEDCVNAVGVDLNMASAPLLCHISGLNKTLAANIIEYRETHGRFTSRQQLLKVTRLGPKAYQQAAGFLRINQGKNPLDNSSVHPEAYAVVKAMATSLDQSVEQLIGNSHKLAQLSPAQFTDQQFGLPTIEDIIEELDKPARDPRPEFTTASFKEGIESIKDLQPAMILEGIITNVTNFGAFVDIGVHQDGLVHISALSDRFVSDPRTVVKTGQIVKVKVLDVDCQRKRIALTMQLTASAPEKVAAVQKQPTSKPQQPAHNSGFADAFSRAKKGS